MDDIARSADDGVGLSSHKQPSFQRGPAAADNLHAKQTSITDARAPHLARMPLYYGYCVIQYIVYTMGSS